jgi:iron complex transport system substrate-binding protein
MLLAQNKINTDNNFSLDEINKIITIGGSITETVFALGMGDHIVATDQSSTFPPQVYELPRVPYVRNLTSEGVISLQADLIISSDEVKPLSAVKQIRDAGIPLIIVEEIDTFEGANTKISTIGKILNKKEKANEIITLNEIQYKETQNALKNLSDLPEVMFVLSMRNGNFIVAGAKTGAQSIIELAGGINAFNSFDGYKTVTNESIILENPDFILAMESRAHNIIDELNGLAGINSINAVVNNSIIKMDGNYLLGFGPRFGSALIELMNKLHPSLELKINNPN